MHLSSQILEITPPFPTIDDVITITYDASEGNQALLGVTPIYGHMGLITDQSSSMTNWQNVQGTWGTADANVLMSDLGNDQHQIVVDVDQFYGVPQSTIIQKLAFVFRNANGSIVGRAANGADIYYEMYPVGAGFLAKFFTPETSQVIDLNDQLNILAQSNNPAQLEIFDNGTLIASISNNTILSHTITASSPGDHEVVLVASDGTTILNDTIHYVVNPPLNIIDPPLGVIHGVNRIDANSVIISMYAPLKNNIYVLGDFNNWQPSVAYHMNQSSDGETWWIEINGLVPDMEYGYQYLIDNNLTLADPLSEKIADPNNDDYIDSITYPNAYDYPENKTTGFISLFETEPTPYNWQNDNITMPDKDKLTIYELLVRDFISSHNYLTIIDTLDYLDSLGINAIELMPIGEFENNESWGYNPSFHMALDKYYGTPDHFKSFVDACHARGIAVIVDIALNHTFGQNPMVNMYWDAQNNSVSQDNPWFNVTCPHPPYCWGYDMDHEAIATQNYIDRVNLHWINEYHIDGFRFDFTRGFLNGANNYSNTRIDLLKRMADTIWTQDPEAYVILEHWADNNEEIELSNYGMLLWGNMTYEYHQAMKGYSSNLNWGIHTERGWTLPHLITYIESHDEERGMYETLNFGITSNPDHNTTVEHVALNRSETAAVILLSTPGPKMIWQFGELGYDISIDFPCRTCNKPILWNYYLENNRRKLYDVYKAMNYLRENFSTFHTTNFQYSLVSNIKKITLLDSSMDAVTYGNFAIDSTQFYSGFPYSGFWYEYFTGDTLEVVNVNMQLEFAPGEYRIYTSTPIAKPEIINVTSIIENELPTIELYPNPASEIIYFTGDKSEFSSGIIIDANGKFIDRLNKNKLQQGIIDVSTLCSGTYYLLLESEGGVISAGKFEKY